MAFKVPRSDVSPWTHWPKTCGASSFKLNPLSLAMLVTSSSILPCASHTCLSVEGERMESILDIADEAAEFDCCAAGTIELDGSISRLCPGDGDNGGHSISLSKRARFSSSSK
ncbi:hypothetical protein MLD38_040495 [Melastoma candidum]|nr:hypothetical protein MLD38_040495 [Melastoma candidum]